MPIISVIIAIIIMLLLVLLIYLINRRAMFARMSGFKGSGLEAITELEDCGAVNSSSMNDDFNPLAAWSKDPSITPEILKRIIGKDEHLDNPSRKMIPELNNLKNKPHPEAEQFVNIEPLRGSVDSMQPINEADSTLSRITELYLASNLPGDGDAKLAAKMLESGRRSQQATINRVAYNANSLRPYVSEELKDNENRIWYEDFEDLEYFM